LLYLNLVEVAQHCGGIAVYDELGERDLIPFGGIMTRSQCHPDIMYDVVRRTKLSQQTLSHTFIAQYIVVFGEQIVPTLFFNRNIMLPGLLIAGALDTTT
jgi:hypothetical protein